MQDINYQLDKDKRPPTNSATRVPECYHNFLDVFSKKVSNIISAHSKYNHVIRLVNEKDHDQTALRPMLNKKLIFVKKFLENNLKKALLKQTVHPAPRRLY